MSQGTIVEVSMCSHLMEIRVTERKVTSDPAMPKKTSKTKKPKPKNLEKVHPARFELDSITIFFGFMIVTYFVTF